MQTENSAISFDIVELLMRLLRRWWLLLLCGVVVGGGFFVYNEAFVTRLYEANCRMIVITREDANNNVTADQLNSAESMINTYAEIISGRDFLKTVQKELGRSTSETACNALRAKIGISAVQDTQIMKIYVRDADPKEALTICKAIYKTAPAYTKEKGKLGSMEQLDGPSKESEVAKNKVFPNVKRNTLLGFALGVMIPAILIALQMLFENTYKNDTDLRNDLDLPVIGIVPMLDEEKSKVSSNRRSSEREAL